MQYLIKKIKKIISYYASIKNKNDQNFDEIIEHELNNIFLKQPYNNKLTIDETKKLLKELRVGTSLVEGLNIVNSLVKTSDIEGDVCEFGVAQGKTSKLIASLIKKNNKKLYLFDSFSGLPSPTAEDQLKDDIYNLKDIKKYEGKMSVPEEKVLSELSDVNYEKKNFIINKGYFSKETMASMKLPNVISFAYLDFDFYKPTYDALNLVNKSLNSKGIIIVDDYDFFSTGVKTAVDKWMNENEKKYSIEKIKTNSASFVILNNNQ